VVTKHCNFNTKIGSPPSENNETPQKFLWWFAVILSLKIWKQIFGNDYYGFKRGDECFIEILKSSMSYLINHFLPYFCYKSVK